MSSTSTFTPLNNNGNNNIHQPILITTTEPPSPSPSHQQQPNSSTTLSIPYTPSSSSDHIHHPSSAAAVVRSPISPAPPTSIQHLLPDRLRVNKKTKNVEDAFVRLDKVSLYEILKIVFLGIPLLIPLRGLCILVFMVSWLLFSKLFIFNDWIYCGCLFLDRDRRKRSIDDFTRGSIKKHLYSLLSVMVRVGMFICGGFYRIERCHVTRSQMDQLRRQYCISGMDHVDNNTNSINNNNNSGDRQTLSQEQQQQQQVDSTIMTPQSIQSMTPTPTSSIARFKSDVPLYGSTSELQSVAINGDDNNSEGNDAGGGGEVFQHDEKSCYTIVSNHVSMLDVFIHLQEFGPLSMLGKGTLRKIPIVSTVIEQMNCLLYDHNTKGKLMDMMREREMAYRSDDSKSRLIIYPEGTTTNGQHLIQFHRGAFVNGSPVQPVVIHHPFKHFNIAWDSISSIHFFLRLLSQFVNRTTIVHFPPYEPTPFEKEHPDVFSENVRRIMCHGTNLVVPGQPMKLSKCFFTRW